MDWIILETSGRFKFRTSSTSRKFWEAITQRNRVPINQAPIKENIVDLNKSKKDFDSPQSIFCIALKKIKINL